MTVNAIRQAIERALKAWLVSSFADKDEFSRVTYTKGQDATQIKMPLASGVCTRAEEVEIPGAGIFSADAAIVLMTTIDSGESPAEVEREAQDKAHQARADCVANKLEDLAGFISALNAGNQVHIYGLDLGKSSHDVESRHYVDKFELTLKCRCA